MDVAPEAAHRMAAEMKENDWCARDLGSTMLAFVAPRSLRKHRFAPYDPQVLREVRKLGLVGWRTIRVLTPVGMGYGQIQEFDVYSAAR
jgi:hypothetical protein